MLDLINEKEAKCRCRLAVSKTKIKNKIFKIDFQRSVFLFI
jgi:hypothetical protein